MGEKPDTRSGLPAGQSANLLSLISYQTGSVVSRTIIGGKAGSVTLFAFDSGEGLSEHTAPFDALVYVLEGNADINIAGTENHLVEGDAIVLPARKPHSLHAPKRFRMLLTMIRTA